MNLWGVGYMVDTVQTIVLGQSSFQLDPVGMFPRRRATDAVTIIVIRVLGILRRKLRGFAAASNVVISTEFFLTAKRTSDVMTIITRRALLFWAG
jgi:hypothetical protein